MSGVNKCFFIGNLGKQAEVRSTDNGGKVANFTLAVSESYKNKSGERTESTEWINVVFWGPVVDVIEKYTKKGSKVCVEGKYKTRTYEKDGEKKYITEILGQNITLLDAKGSSDGGSEKPSSKPAQVEDPEEDDLPF